MNGKTLTPSWHLASLLVQTGRWSNLRALVDCALTYLRSSLAQSSLGSETMSVGSVLDVWWIHGFFDFGSQTGSRCSVSDCHHSAYSSVHLSSTLPRIRFGAGSSLVPFQLLLSPVLFFSGFCMEAAFRPMRMSSCPYNSNSLGLHPKIRLSASIADHLPE